MLERRSGRRSRERGRTSNEKISERLAGNGKGAFDDAAGEALMAEIRFLLKTSERRRQLL